MYDPAVGASGGPVELAAVQPLYAPSRPGDAMALTPAERISVSNALLDLANAIESGITVRNTLKLTTAVLAGLLQTNGPIALFKNPGGTKNRVVVTLGAGGQRTSVTFDFS